MKRIAAVVTLVAAAIGFGAPAAMAAPAATGQVCIHLNLNGSDLINQCVGQ